MKKVLTLIAFTLCLLAVPRITQAATSVSNVQTAAVTKTVGTVTANPALNLRKTAVSTSAILVAIPKNSQVAVISKNTSNWYNVTYSGKTGWVSGAYLTVKSVAVTTTAPKPVVPAPPVATKIVGTVTANPVLNLRKTAVSTSAVLAAIPKNSQVAVISKNASNWYNVTYSGKTGWVSGAYLTVKTIAVTATATATAPKPVVPAPPVATKTVGTVTASPALNLRKTAVSTSAVLAAIPKNSQVAVISKNTSNWYNVTYSSQTGWVSGAYLTVKTVAVTGTGTAPAPVTGKEPSLVGKTIVLDAGHGYPDSGAVGPTGTKEKDNTLAIASMLATVLKAGGANVIMTRTNDNAPTNGNFDTRSDLQYRTSVANNAKADIFVSIHNDAFSNPAASGTSTYYSAANAKSALSMQLAADVQAELIKALGTSNRGVNQAGDYVIKYTNMPAILVEAAFITNPTEEKKLASNSVRQSIANAIMKGIVSYFKQH